MNDTGLVGGVHGFSQDRHQFGGVPSRLGDAAVAIETAAVHELQREERFALIFVDLENLDDVGVAETGEGLGLQAEASQFGPTGMTAGQDHFQGDDSFQSAVDGLVNDAHAAAPQFFQDHVVAYQTRSAVIHSWGSFSLHSGVLKTVFRQASGWYFWFGRACHRRNSVRMGLRKRDRRRSRFDDCGQDGSRNSLDQRFGRVRKLGGGRFGGCLLLRGLVEGRRDRFVGRSAHEGPRFDLGVWPSCPNSHTAISRTGSSPT